MARLLRPVLVRVAEAGDGLAGHVLHDKVRPPGLAGAGVDHPRDVGMVHHRQRLPLRFEACDHLPRVHSQLDQLERDGAADGFDLLGPRSNSEPSLSPNHPLAQLTSLDDHLERQLCDETTASASGLVKSRSSGQHTTLWLRRSEPPSCYTRRRDRNRDYGSARYSTRSAPTSALATFNRLEENPETTQPLVFSRGCHRLTLIVFSERDGTRTRNHRIDSRDGAPIPARKIRWILKTQSRMRPKMRLRRANDKRCQTMTCCSKSSRSGRRSRLLGDG